MHTGKAKDPPNSQPVLMVSLVPEASRWGNLEADPEMQIPVHMAYRKRSPRDSKENPDEVGRMLTRATVSGKDWKRDLTGDLSGSTCRRVVLTHPGQDIRLFMLPRLIGIHLALDSLVEGKSSQGTVLRGLEVWHPVMRTSEYCNLRCVLPVSS